MYKNDKVIRRYSEPFKQKKECKLTLTSAQMEKFWIMQTKLSYSYAPLLKLTPHKNNCVLFLTRKILANFPLTQLFFAKFVVETSQLFLYKKIVHKSLIKSKNS